MRAQPHADEGAARTSSGPESTEPPGRERPNVSGDLSTLFSAAPMFRRVVAGYDRFQVDSYVRWAEDELATADREREHLLTRHLRTQAALDEARQLLAHSAGGGEFLQLSRRIGSMLAAAADEADSMRTEAQAARSAASAQAERTVAHAERVLADAETEATRMVSEAAGEVAAMTAEAGRITDGAEQMRRQARIEAAARLDEARAVERRAAEVAERTRQQARRDASAALLHARDEVVRMLTIGREERRRADAQAAATRERLDHDAVARRTALLAEVADLEHRRQVLRADLDRAAAETVARTPRNPYWYVRRHVERIHERLGSPVVGTGGSSGT